MFIELKPHGWKRKRFLLFRLQQKKTKKKAVAELYALKVFDRKVFKNIQDQVFH